MILDYEFWKFVIPAGFCWLLTIEFVLISQVIKAHVRKICWDIITAKWKGCCGTKTYQKRFSILQLWWYCAFICEKSPKYQTQPQHISCYWSFTLSLENIWYYLGAQKQKSGMIWVKGFLKTFIAFLKHYKIKVYQRWKSSCSYQEVNNVSFLGKFAYAVNGRSNVLMKIK